MSKKFLSGVFSLFLAAFCLTGLAALDFNIRPRGYALIPLGKGNKSAGGDERYSPGGGGDLAFELDLASLWSNPLGIGYTVGCE